MNAWLHLLTSAQKRGYDFQFSKNIFPAENVNVQYWNSVTSSSWLASVLLKECLKLAECDRLQEKTVLVNLRQLFTNVGMNLTLRISWIILLSKQVSKSKTTVK